MYILGNVKRIDNNIYGLLLLHQLVKYEKHSRQKENIFLNHVFI